MMYKIYYTGQARKDYKYIKNSPLSLKLEELLDIITINPYQNPPPYKFLSGNMRGAISRRLNFQHRLVYEVIEDEKAIKVMRMWTHYE